MLSIVLQNPSRVCPESGQSGRFCDKYLSARLQCLPGLADWWPYTAVAPANGTRIH